MHYSIIAINALQRIPNILQININCCLWSQEEEASGGSVGESNPTLQLDDENKSAKAHPLHNYSAHPLDNYSSAPGPAHLLFYFMT
jgi:hypothetical protein